MKLLIADDSDLFRERFVKMLSRSPEIEIIGQARDVVETKSLILELKPDIVTLDIRMPKGSGLDVLKYIKKNMPAISVIVLTNYPYEQLREECMAQGADFFLDKSNDFGEIVKILKQLAADLKV